MATVAKNRKKRDEIYFVCPLKLLGQLDPSFAKIIQGINHRPFHQSLVLSDQVVLEENIF
jgi:hypothetical protein